VVIIFFGIYVQQERFSVKYNTSGQNTNHTKPAAIIDCLTCHSAGAVSNRYSDVFDSVTKIKTTVFSSVPSFKPNAKEAT
jgi:hypothetical protein